MSRKAKRARRRWPVRFLGISPIAKNFSRASTMSGRNEPRDLPRDVNIDSDSLTAVANTVVSPWVAMTEPSARGAMRPVSRLSSLPPKASGGDLIVCLVGFAFEIYVDHSASCCDPVTDCES